MVNYFVSCMNGGVISRACVMLFMEHETCNKGNPMANLGVKGISLQFQFRAVS